ncbi:MAG TPA: SMP-30/gluconolactonase/LRE family protein [Acidimicrobiales bacterium]
MTNPDVVVEGLAFGEGPRWRDGRLWFSDMHAGVVQTFDPGTGALTMVAEVPGTPSGLGWDPAGRLLIVSMDERRLLRLSGDGALDEVADLSGYTDFPINDMVVSAAGTAYIGGFGFDLHGGGTPVDTVMLAVDTADGSHRVAATDLAFPNGMVITPDGSTLIVGESFGARLTAFTIDAGGALQDRRVWASLGDSGAFPDGCCLDADGCIWIASPGTHECVRVREGGEVLARISTGDRLAIACMLGDDDRRSLYILSSKGLDPQKARELRSGRLERVRVDVPGAGLP